MTQPLLDLLTDTFKYQEHRALADEQAQSMEGQPMLTLVALRTAGMDGQSRDVVCGILHSKLMVSLPETNAPPALPIRRKLLASTGLYLSRHVQSFRKKP